MINRLLVTDHLYGMVLIILGHRYPRGYLLIHNIDRGIKTDQKDGIAEIVLPFSQHQAPLNSGFFLFLCVQLDLVE